jgi:hypothetical protein
VDTVPDWMICLFSVKTSLKMRSWEERMSIDNGILKTSNSNIKDVIQSLKDDYNDILYEHRYMRV